MGIEHQLSACDESHASDIFRNELNDDTSHTHSSRTRAFWGEQMERGGAVRSQWETIRSTAQLGVGIILVVMIVIALNIYKINWS